MQRKKMGFQLLSSNTMDIKKGKIVHLSSVHARYDNRILLKECVSLVNAGYDVTLYISDGEKDENFKGVKIINIGTKRSILQRFTRTIPKMLKTAIQKRADVYHFHDPELIPVGLILRILGYKVIYDIHEDYTTAIRQKRYLNSLAAKIISFAFDFFERFSAHFFINIIAEKYYINRFPKSTPILNYPIFSEEVSTFPNLGKESRILKKLLYTGNITLDRGAENHAKMLRELEDIELTMIGKCDKHIAKIIEDEVGEERGRLTLIGVDVFVNPDDIDKKYKNEMWLAGIALFPKTAHYDKKELTKFFEYMKYGLPIICSDFSAWKTLVEDNNIGIAVDPNNLAEIGNAIEKLHNNPTLYNEMSENGIKLVRSTFNWVKEEQKLIRLYKTIMAGTAFVR